MVLFVYIYKNLFAVLIYTAGLYNLIKCRPV
jgi:hypothetical protein